MRSILPFTSQYILDADNSLPVRVSLKASCHSAMLVVSIGGLDHLSMNKHTQLHNLPTPRPPFPPFPPFPISLSTPTDTHQPGTHMEHKHTCTHAHTLASCKYYWKVTSISFYTLIAHLVNKTFTSPRIWAVRMFPRVAQSTSPWRSEQKKSNMATYICYTIRGYPITFPSLLTDPPHRCIIMLPKSQGRARERGVHGNLISWLSPCVSNNTASGVKLGAWKLGMRQVTH